MSIFSERKVPRHLILQEEFEYRKKPKFSISKLILWSFLLALASFVLIKVPIF